MGSGINPEGRGNEVAGAALEPFRLVGKTLTGNELALFEGLDHLAARPERFDWNEICVLYERTETVCAGRMSLEECGRLGIQAPKFKQIIAAAAAVTSPKLLYTLGNKFGLARTFSHLSLEQTELPTGELRIQIGIPETHEHSDGFFRITRGILQALPVVLGLPAAIVDLEIRDHVGTFTVRVPHSQTIPARIARTLRALFGGTRVLEQLNAQQAELNDHYKELQAAYLEVHAALEVKRRFMSIMSHELRTPLNGIIGAGTALQHETDVEVRKSLHEALDASSAAMTRLVDGVLELARSETAAPAPVRVDVDFAALVEDVVQSTASSCRQKDLRFDVRLDPSVQRRFECDGPRFAQVLDRLLDNAVKFTPKGHVTFDVRFDDGVLEATISDTGIGIPKSRHRDIFELFTQMDDGSTRAHGGAGLGLALVNRQVRSMNGSIDLTSEPGVGSTFTVRVPAVAVETPDAVVLNKKPNSRVLVVDDNRVNRLVVTRMLKKLEWDVSEAENGQEAVDLATTDDFAVILMDCEMPVMNGWDATIRIRQILQDSPPIIAITAYVSDEDRERCRDAGMCDFIPKPVSPNQMKRTLQRWTNSFDPALT